MIIGVWVKIYLTVGPLDSPDHPVVISPVPECIIEIVIGSNFKNHHLSSMIHEICVIFGRKGQVGATRVASTFEKTKFKIKPHSCRNCRDISTINIPITFLFNSLIWPVEKTLILENNSGLL